MCVRVVMNCTCHELHLILLVWLVCWSECTCWDDSRTLLFNNTQELLIVLYTKWLWLCELVLEWIEIVTHLTCFMRHCITQSVKASCKTPFELNSKCSPFNWFYEALLCHWYSLWRLHPCKAPFELNSKCSPFNCFVTYVSTRALCTVQSPILIGQQL